MRKGVVAVVAGAVLAAGVVAAVDLRHTPVTVAGPLAQPSPYPVRTPLLAPQPAGLEPTTSGLQRALSAVLHDPGLGSRLSMSVVDVQTGAPLYALGAAAQVVPASTAKLATAVAALTVLPPDRTLPTQAVAGSPGDVVLVGGGDASLDLARLKALAAQVLATGTAVKRVVVDDTLYAGPRLGPGWKPGYVQDGDVAPVSALAVDQGRTSTRQRSPRVADPALAAGQAFAAALGAKTVVRGRAPAMATVLGQVQSLPVAALVERMLTRSDNDLAEALGRQVALAEHLPATFEGEAAAIGGALREQGLDVALHDASGLSPRDRVEPATMTALLAKAATGSALGPVLSGLPVAGFDGTLGDRFRTPPAAAAAGLVRAKTGTLDGVSALAGLVLTRDGRLLAFDLTADAVPVGGTSAAERALDRIATALSGCGCP